MESSIIILNPKDGFRLRIFYVRIKQMENLDLNIQNYSIENLKMFFQMNQPRPYTVNEIEGKEYELREMLLKSGRVDRRFTADLITFLSKAKTTLVDALVVPVRPATVIPRNQPLDQYNYPLSAPVRPRTDELKSHTDANFVFSQQSDFFQGSMNPLTTRILTNCLNVDTRFRDNLSNTQSSDFIIQLPRKFNKVVSMHLSALEFPVQFYAISAAYGNNFLYLGVTYNDFVDIGLSVNVNSVFTVPDGNYTNQDLVNVLNALLCPLNPDGSIKFPNSIYSYLQFTIDANVNGSGTRKLTLAPTGAFGQNITNVLIDFTKDINGNTDLTSNSIKIGWNLGFINYIYTGKTQYTADSVMDLNTFRYVYLAVDDFQKTANNYFTSVFSDSILTPDILARISTTGTTNDIAINGDIRVVTEPRKYFGPVDIQRLRVRLYDTYGRILPMNGVNYSFCLTLKMVYDL